MKYETMDLFATPKSIEEMQDYLAKFNGSEAVIANTCAFMMYNLMVTLINEEKEL